MKRFKFRSDDSLGLSGASLLNDTWTIEKKYANDGFCAAVLWNIPYSGLLQSVY